MDAAQTTPLPYALFPQHGAIVIGIDRVHES